LALMGSVPISPGAATVPGHQNFYCPNHPQFHPRTTAFRSLTPNERRTFHNSLWTWKRSGPNRETSNGLVTRLFGWWQQNRSRSRSGTLFPSRKTLQPCRPIACQLFAWNGSARAVAHFSRLMDRLECMPVHLRERANRRGTPRLAGALCLNDDIARFVSQPCSPPMFVSHVRENDNTSHDGQVNYP